MAVRTGGWPARDRILRALNAKLSQVAQKSVYRYATRRLNSDDVVFLNYGYEEDPSMGLALSSADEPNRFPIQLYHRTASQVGLGGKRVLEVGCGHGGGASYITRAFGPESYTGLDVNPVGIEYCRRQHRLPNLDFVQGDAEDLPFPGESFDAVINVESSHLYPRFSRFLDEVGRVLRPGGHFLYTDARPSRLIAEWEAALAAGPLQVVSQQVINAEVRRGMKMTLEDWQDVIDRVTPKMFRRIVHDFAPAQKAYDDLGSEGGSEYRLYCFSRS